MADGSSNELLGTKPEGVSSQESLGKMTRPCDEVQADVQLVAAKTNEDHQSNLCCFLDEIRCPLLIPRATASKGCKRWTLSEDCKQKML